MKFGSPQVVLVLGMWAAASLAAQDEMPVAPSNEPPRVIRFDPAPAKEEALAAGEDNVVPKPEATEIVHKDEVKRLLGKHLFALQWISWDDFGTAEIKDENGVWSLKAEQKSKEKGNKDFANLDGWITKVEEGKFTFQGRIETQVSHMNGGKPCIRTGEFVFEVKEKRKYYRLVQMENPCEGQNVVDYLDIFFKGPKG